MPNLAGKFRITLVVANAVIMHGNQFAGPVATLSLSDKILSQYLIGSFALQFGSEGHFV